MRSLPLFLVLLTLAGCRTTRRAPTTPTLLPPIQSEYLKGYQAPYRTPQARLYRNGYHYLIERLPDHTYQYQQFYPESGQRTLRCTYADATLQQLAGSYQSWWDNGHRKATGQYQQGVPDGEWRFYEPTAGRLYCIGHYRLGAAEGPWQYLDPNTAQPTVRLHLTNGQRNGPFQLQDTTGQLAARGRYFLGNLDALQWDGPSPDTTLLPLLDFDFRRMQGQRLSVAAAPQHCGDYYGEERLQCTTAALNRWIDRQLRLPAIVRQQRLEGQVTLAFHVDARGRLTRINIPTSLCQPLQEAIYAALEGFPAEWAPAQYRGQPVASTFYHDFWVGQQPQAAPPRLLRPDERKRMR